MKILKLKYIFFFLMINSFNILSLIPNTIFALAPQNQLKEEEGYHYAMMQITSHLKEMGLDHWIRVNAIDKKIQFEGLLLNFAQIQSEKNFIISSIVKEIWLFFLKTSC